MDSSHITLILIVSTLLYHAIRRYIFFRSYPPGPRGPPFIGAAFEMPREKEWVTYDKWKRKYGPIVGLTSFGQPIVILNTAQLAQQVLNGRQNIYSDRPPFPMLEMMGFLDWNMGIMKSGPTLSLARRLFAQEFSPSGAAEYSDVHKEEVSMLLKRLGEEPSRFTWAIRRFNVGLILKIFYGLLVEDKEGHDDFVQLNDHVITATSLAGSPAAYLVNTFPFLKYWPSSFPGAAFKKDALEGLNLSERLVNAPHETLRERLARVDTLHRRSFLGKQATLQHGPDTELHQKAAHAAVATAYGAGVETSTSVLLTFILCMVHYPKVQRKAQADIDHVIAGRLPSLEDKETGKLPIIDAIVKECFRWRPPGNFALPHKLIQDDIVSGYMLPKDTVVMSNVWSILHDENEYPHPMEFNPDRFLNDKLQADPRDHVFGYGRRICPGRHLADRSLWLAIASILACFDILPERDEKGNVKYPTIDYTSGVMSRPKDFHCIIKPRK
ncbi:hypothetical protein AMATHDRAFT_41649 [Amanita thiersii Skay4041]|uniref:Cytochrome P450 n=1 Tax=Amanita thiersii Skay4041 TaxID=703135 RepID=A0A2A9NLX2_9AGAR|nr:hypothetical protein AMATHDRAFT_41649 [Amanita thiersii Skay4041]